MKPFVDKTTGKPLVDLKAPIEFMVRPADIAAACQADNHHCVVAQSLARRDEILSLTIGTQVVTLEYGDHVVRGFHSEPLKRAVREFDQTGYFVPGAYVVRPPSPSKRLGHQKPKTPPTGKESKRPRVVFSTLRPRATIRKSVLEVSS